MAMFACATKAYRDLHILLWRQNKQAMAKNQEHTPIFTLIDRGYWFRFFFINDPDSFNEYALKGFQEFKSCNSPEE